MERTHRRKIAPFDSIPQHGISFLLNSFAYSIRQRAEDDTGKIIFIISLSVFVFVYVSSCVHIFLFSLSGFYSYMVIVSFVIVSSAPFTFRLFPRSLALARFVFNFQFMNRANKERIEFGSESILHARRCCHRPKHAQRQRATESIEMRQPKTVQRN